MLEDYVTRNREGERKFKKGETVVGNETVNSPNVRVIPSITTLDGFLILKSIVKEVPVVEVDKAQDIVTKTQNIVKGSAFKQGAVVGVALGAGYGFFYNKNIFFSALIGMALGGAVGHFMFSKK
jgi:hypothetical protein